MSSNIEIVKQSFMKVGSFMKMGFALVIVVSEDGGITIYRGIEKYTLMSPKQTLKTLLKATTEIMREITTELMAKIKMKMVMRMMNKMIWSLFGVFWH